MLLLIVYGVSIGGIVMLIGMLLNVFMVVYLLDSYKIDIGFVEWMKVGVLFVIVMFILCWVWLIKFVYKVDI